MGSKERAKDKRRREAERRRREKEVLGPILARVATLENDILVLEAAQAERSKKLADSSDLSRSPGCRAQQGLPGGGRRDRRSHRSVGSGPDGFGGGEGELRSRVPGFLRQFIHKL